MIAESYDAHRAPLQLFYFLASQPLKRLQIFGGRSRDDVAGQLRPGRRLVPIERLEVIAHELLVKTGRALPDHILIFRPEAGRIRSQAFVDQQQLSIDRPEFEFCVRNDNSALRGMIATPGINFQTELAHFGCDFATENSTAFLHVDVEIVLGIAFCRRRKNRLRQLRREFQSCGQFFSANALRLLILFPAGATV